MERFKTSNGLTMIATPYINWQVVKENRDDTGREFLRITVGGLLDMWSWIYDCDKELLFFKKLDYEGNDPVRFKCSLEMASDIILAFTEAMNINLKGTIYEV